MGTATIRLKELTGAFPKLELMGNGNLTALNGICKDRGRELGTRWQGAPCTCPEHQSGGSLVS